MSFCPAVAFDVMIVPDRYGRRRETGSVESEDSGLPQSEPAEDEHNHPHPFSVVQSAFKQLHI